MQVNLTRIDLVVVGSASATLEPALRDFERRLGRYAKLRVHELKGEPLQRGEDHVRSIEGARIVATLDSLARQGTVTPTVIALDSKGSQLTSAQFAEQLLVARHLVLLVGGAAGFHRDLIARADQRIGFGAATLPHQLARLVATEQLYRAFRIARGEPYHH